MSPCAGQLPIGRKRLIRTYEHGCVSGDIVLVCVCLFVCKCVFVSRFILVYERIEFVCLNVSAYVCVEMAICGE